MIIYLCTKFESNTPILSKAITLKPFFKVEIFSKLKRAITPKIIGGFYPKSNSNYILWLYLIELELHFMIIYLCIKFQSNTPILSKDIARKPKVLRTGLTYVRTAVILYAPIENGGGIIKTDGAMQKTRLIISNKGTSLCIRLCRFSNFFETLKGYNSLNFY